MSRATIHVRMQPEMIADLDTLAEHFQMKRGEYFGHIVSAWRHDGPETFRKVSAEGTKSLLGVRMDQVTIDELDAAAAVVDANRSEYIRSMVNRWVLKYLD